MADFSEQIIKPENCVFAVTVPLKKADFEKDLSSPVKEYARSYPTWSLYQKQLVEVVERLCPQYHDMYGANVEYDVSLERFGKIFNVFRRPLVVVLFGHSYRTGEGVEFFDGFASNHIIVDAIPVDFEGMMDLSVCNGELLALKIRNEREYCLARCSGNSITPDIWLHFFLLLFGILYEEELTYLSAFKMALEFFKGGNR
jgi:hypothetical protein